MTDKQTGARAAAREIADLIDIGFVIRGRLKNHDVIKTIILKHCPDKAVGLVEACRLLNNIIKDARLSLPCGSCGQPKPFKKVVVSLSAEIYYKFQAALAEYERATNE
jgi:hypothetical protein